MFTNFCKKIAMKIFLNKGGQSGVKGCLDFFQKKHFGSARRRTEIPHQMIQNISFSQMTKFKPPRRVWHGAMSLCTVIEETPPEKRSGFTDLQCRSYLQILDVWDHRKFHMIVIHPKSWGSWGLNPAYFFGFSANSLAENPKSFKFSVCVETALPILSKSCSNIA